MKTVYSFFQSFSVVILLLGALFAGCSVAETSRPAFSKDSTTGDLSKLTEFFKNCVIGKVLADNTIEVSKAACLIETQKFCERDQIIKDSANRGGCSDLVSKATKNIIEKGRSVECDSGYCTIVY